MIGDGVGYFKGAEFGEAAEVVALDGIDAALEAVVDLVTVIDQAAFGEVRIGKSFVVLEFPKLGLATAQAAEHPLAIDQDIDDHAALGSGRVVALAVFGEESQEVGGIFTGDDFGLGVNAGFQGVEAGDGLACIGARAGGFLRVQAVGFDLVGCGHKMIPALRLAGGQAGTERWRWLSGLVSG